MAEEANFFIWKIHFVNADGFAVHFHYHADRDVILSEKVFDGFLSAVFTGLRNKDIVASPPQCRYAVPSLEAAETWNGIM